MMSSEATKSQQKQANGTIGWYSHARTNRDKLPTLSDQDCSTRPWKLNRTGNFKERKQYLSYMRLHYRRKTPWWGSSFEGPEKAEKQF